MYVLPFISEVLRARCEARLLHPPSLGTLDPRSRTPCAHNQRQHNTETAHTATCCGVLMGRVFQEGGGSERVLGKRRALEYWGVLVDSSSPPACPFKGPKDHITQGSDILVPRPNIRGIPEIIICWILLLMWSISPLPLDTTVGWSWGFCSGMVALV